MHKMAQTIRCLAQGIKARVQQGGHESAVDRGWARRLHCSAMRAIPFLRMSCRVYSSRDQPAACRARKRRNMMANTRKQSKDRPEAPKGPVPPGATRKAFER